MRSHFRHAAFCGIQITYLGRHGEPENRLILYSRVAKLALHDSLTP